MIPPAGVEFKLKNGMTAVKFFGKQYSLSNFHRADIEMDMPRLGRVRFRSSEHAYMVERAVFFEDWELARQIIEAATPNVAKQLAKSLLPDQASRERWAEVKTAAMRRVLRAKFEQNPHLLASLLQTREKLLIEASPVDLFWGIGADIDSPECGDVEIWKGRNQLGFLLREIREEFLEQQPEPEQQQSSSNTFRGPQQQHQDASRGAARTFSMHDLGEALNQADQQQSQPHQKSGPQEIAPSTARQQQPQPQDQQQRHQQQQQGGNILLKPRAMLDAVNRARQHQQQWGSNELLEVLNQAANPLPQPQGPHEMPEQQQQQHQQPQPFSADAILKRMGWQTGHGLGKRLQGRLEPVPIDMDNCRINNTRGIITKDEQYRVPPKMTGLRPPNLADPGVRFYLICQIQPEYAVGCILPTPPGALYNNHGWKFGVKFPHDLAIGQLFLPGDQVGVERGRWDEAKRFIGHDVENDVASKYCWINESTRLLSFQATALRPIDHRRPRQPELEEPKQLKARVHEINRKRLPDGTQRGRFAYMIIRFDDGRPDARLIEQQLGARPNTFSVGDIVLADMAPLPPGTWAQTWYLLPSDSPFWRDVEVLCDEWPTRVHRLPHGQRSKPSEERPTTEAPWPWTTHPPRPSDEPPFDPTQPGPSWRY